MCRSAASNGGRASVAAGDLSSRICRRGICSKWDGLKIRIVTYTWTLRYAKRFLSVLDRRNRLLAYIRPVIATPVAGPDGICWLTPCYAIGLLKSRTFCRLGQPRSYLWSHHFGKHLCNRWWEGCVKDYCRYRSLCRCWARRAVTGLKIAAMSQ
jgi:hypothetical protein